MKTYYPKTIDEAINSLEVFFDSDIWFASQNEWKSEIDAQTYIKNHFEILRKEITRIRKSKRKKEVNQ